MHKVFAVDGAGDIINQECGVGWVQVLIAYTKWLIMDVDGRPGD